jgi:hypothetical protein
MAELKKVRNIKPRLQARPWFGMLNAAWKPSPPACRLGR